MEENKKIKQISIALTSLKPGEKADIINIKTKDEIKLRKLSAFGILPGNVVEVIQKYPAVVIQIGFTQVALDDAIAGDIIVSKL